MKKFIYGLIVAMFMASAANAGLFKIDSLSVAQPNPAIDYLSPLTRAAARTYESKFSDIVNVMDFPGCDPTGTTDSTTCIQDAISSLSGATTGATIDMPPGIFKISSAIDFGDKQNVYLKGAGINATVIKVSGSAAAAIKFGTGSGTSFQGVSDLSIDSSSDSTAYGIIVNTVNTFILRDVNIDSASVGIRIINGAIQYYNNFTILNSGAIGIYITGGNDQYLTNGLLISPGGVQPTQAGIRCDQSDAFWILNVDTINQGTGLLLNPGSGQYITWPFVMNSAFDTGNGAGISLVPSGTGLIKGGTFTSNWTSTNQSSGMDFGGTGTIDGIRVIGHRSFNNTQSGYKVVNGTNIAFDSSDASGNSGVSPGTYSGFDIGAGISGFSITNSRSGSAAGFGNTQLRGILINPGASDNYVISNNDLRGNTVPMLDGGTGTNKIVKGNLGYNPIANTSITVGASPFTWTNNTGDTVNVYISGGTVSSVVASPGNPIGSATGMSATVPQGQSVTVTYSVAPTMSYNGF